MQEHIAKPLRISILIWLLLLAAAFPYLITYYEQQQAYQWQDMVQPHWEKMARPAPADLQDVVVVQNVVVQNDIASEDVAEWKNLDVPTVPDTEAVEQKQPAPEKTVLEKPVLNKPVPKKVTRKKNEKLALKVPENIYQGEVAAWEDKKQISIPDFFAPKKDSPSRFQFGGRLILDEDKKKKEAEAADAGYLDAVQGAEVNISISTP